MSHAWSASMVMARSVCDKATEDVTAHGAQVASLGDPRSPRSEVVENRNEGRHRDRSDDQAGPEERRNSGQDPGGYQHEKRRRRNQASAEVVHHLPSALGGNAGLLLPPRGVAREAQDPRQELPVAPHPSMVAAGGHLVVGGELLEEIHIGQQPCAREHALEKIVAEEGALRDLPLQRRLEDVDVVDPLPRVGAPLEEVLVHIGHRRRVGVHASGARDDPLVGRASGAGRQRRRDPGLQDPVALDDASLLWVESWPVERVRDRPDQSVGGPFGKPGVGIQGDDVANPLGHRGRLSVDRDERGVRGAAKKTVQLVELPSLPFPSDPLAFPLVPQTPAMQQKEPLPPPGGPSYFSLRRAMPSIRAARSSSSPGMCSWRASVQSERRAKWRCPSEFAR